MALESSFVQGYFIEELKNRFRCEVEIDGKSQLCYVPTSCPLKNFVELPGKKVLLSRNKSEKSKTSYALYAVPFKKNYIVLNTAIANHTVKRALPQRRFSWIGARQQILTEGFLGQYKYDIYIPDTNTIIEIKSLISIEKEVVIPQIESERTLRQLSEIYSFQEKGYSTYLFFVSMHPYLSSVKINTDSKLYKALKPCIAMGTIVKAYNTRLSMDNGLVLKKEIPVTFTQVSHNVISQDGGN